MNDMKQEQQKEVLSIQEYLERRKAKQTIDQNGAECYDT